jgi:hypothetical protein
MPEKKRGVPPVPKLLRAEIEAIYTWHIQHNIFEWSLLGGGRQSVAAWRNEQLAQIEPE